MARTERLAHSASRSPDQRPQRGSSVTTSRMTLLSTRTSTGSPTSEGHDLVGGHRRRGLAAHSRQQSASATIALGYLPNLDCVAYDLELHLRVLEEPQSTADRLGNGDLAFRGDPHRTSSRSKTIPTLTPSAQSRQGRALALREDGRQSGEGRMRGQGARSVVNTSSLFP